MILLTKEEMFALMDEFEFDDAIEDWNLIAKAQLKKVVEEQLKPCITFQGNGVVEFELDESDWQSLLKEIE